MFEKSLILVSLPILFMLHDFEEIVMMKSWAVRNESYLIQRFPRLGRRMVSHFKKFSTSSFALAIAEEFFLLSLITVGAMLSPDWQGPWFGAMLVFTLHLAYHVLTALVLIGRYVVASLTSFLFFPLCIYLISLFFKKFQYRQSRLIFWEFLSFLILVANMIFLHFWLIPHFENWLRKYRFYHND
ncbi:MAG: HXXEE domain-containing protein [Streptococcaceae bacterium]|jgi:hypothetical protein|nr:HXXEE domain-containing protein [Streptococcaceae bacterium]